MSLDHSKLTNLKPSSDGWTAACPCCRKEGRDSTGNHLRIWRSGAFSCAINPGSYSHNKAIHALAGVNGSGDYTVQTESKQPEIEVEQIWPSSVLDRLVRDDTYWHGRGISSATLAPFKGGVETAYQMKGRYVFPIFDENDRIIGFDGRRIDGKKERPWKILGKSSLFVWGGVDEIESSRRVILVESIGDSLKLREHGVPDSLCLFGSNLSQTLLAKLVALNPLQIIISTNRDTERVSVTGQVFYPGQDAARKIQKTLDTLFNSDIVVIKHPPVGTKDWGEASHDQIQQAFNPPSTSQPVEDDDSPL